MKEILSKSNDYIKKIAKLKQKKYRKKEEGYLIEGLHLIEEADKYEQEFEAVLFVDKYDDHRVVKKNYDNAYEISDEVADYLADTENSQGIFAVINIAETGKDDFSDQHGKWMLLDNVQDPGNVGTIIRTADAAGFDGVYIGDNTADVYQPKVQRSMQGSQFHIEIRNNNSLHTVQQMKSNGFNVWATEVNDEAVELITLEVPNDLLIVMGNEGNGLSDVILDESDTDVYIPIYGKAESLNVGVAAGIVAYYVANKSN